MAHVRVILRSDVGNLGDAGEVVNVKPGYARNYLVPQGLATVATVANVKELEHHRRAIAEKVEKEVKSLQAEKKKLEKVALSVEAQVGEEGKLFGSVTAQNVADLLAELGIEVDRRKIDLKDPIKTAGEHTVAIKLHREVVAEVKLKVLAVGAPAVVDDRDDLDDEDVREPNAADEGDDR